MTEREVWFPQYRRNEICPHVHDVGLDDPSHANPCRFTLQEAYEEIGIGKFQAHLFMISGLGFMADAIEVGIITFLEYEARRRFTGSMSCRESDVNYLGTCDFAGELLSVFIWGPLADRIGRKKTFILSNFTLALFGILSAFAPSFWILVVMRGLVGINIGGIVVPFDNLLESVSDEHGPMLAYAMNFFWTAGTLFVVGCALVLLGGNIDAVGLSSWRLFLIISASPILAAFIFSFTLEESPEWLLHVGKNEEAAHVIKRAGRMNGKHLPDDMCLVQCVRHEEPSFTEIFKPNYLRRTIALAMLWSFSLFGYYGASFANGTIFGSDSGGDINIGEILFSSSGEVVAVALAVFLSSRTSSRVSLSLFFAIASFGCATLFLIFFFEVNAPVVLLGILAFLLRIGVMGGSCGAWVITPPSYPTHVRATAHSFHYGAGRVGGLAATLFPATTPAWMLMASFSLANSICFIISAVGITPPCRNNGFKQIPTEDSDG